MDRVRRSCRRSAADFHFTDTVTPLWLERPPTETTMGRSPDLALAGICTLSCITPDTKPGASPAKETCAAWPSIRTATGSTGPGVSGGASDKVVTLPVAPFGEVWPSPVM